VAAQTEVKSNKLNVRQSQVIESINFLVDSNIYLGSETNSHKQAGECKVLLFEGF
jgi:hypothetical protein